MNTIAAISLLEDCEKGLRKSAGEALAAGDYDTARRVMMWAENLAAMAAAARRQEAPTPSQSQGAAPAPVQPRAKNRIPENEYPRFQRKGDELVKIGWSKSEKKEYHHRAPKRALDTLVATLRQIASDGSTFTSENLNPLKDPESGGVYPTYQVFVALAWLRQLGLVKQHGRKGGYSLVLEYPFDATVAKAWSELPTWRG